MLIVKFLGKVLCSVDAQFLSMAPYQQKKDFLRIFFHTLKRYTGIVSAWSLTEFLLNCNQNLMG